MTREPTIECARQHNGTWLVSVGLHCAEVADNDAAMDAALDTLAKDSGVPRVKIAVQVVRRQLAGV